MFPSLIHRIIPHKEINGPDRLCVAVQWGMSDPDRRRLENNYNAVVGKPSRKAIWVDEEVSPEQMDEALEYYYP